MVKFIVGLGVIIGVCCWGEGILDIVEGIVGNEGEWGMLLFCRFFGFWLFLLVWECVGLVVIFG